ncbi:hypothetical protein [Persephonella sp.]
MNNDESVEIQTAPSPEINPPPQPETPAQQIAGALEQALQTQPPHEVLAGFAGGNFDHLNKQQIEPPQNPEPLSFLNVDEIIEAYRKGELNENQLLEAYQKINELEALNLHEDPRFNQLVQEEMEKWEAQSPEPYKGKAELTDAEMNQWREWCARKNSFRDKATALAEEKFQQNYPDIYERYRRYGIYTTKDGRPDLNSDPVWKELEKQANALVTKRAENGPPLEVAFEMERKRALERFASAYLEKAQIYALYDADFAKILAETNTKFATKNNTEAPNPETPSDRVKLKLEGNKIFPEVVIFTNKEIPPNSTRVFRGIIDERSLSKQVPYSMRIIDESGNLQIARDLEGLTKRLSQNPSYEALLQLYEILYSRIAKDDLRRRLTDELRMIEDLVLEGSTLEEALKFVQILRVGGYSPDIGLTPYISASKNPKKAAEYGNITIVAYLPPEKIVEIGKDEVGIRGTLSSENIVAIIRKNRKQPTGDEVEKELRKAISVIENYLQRNYHSTPLEKSHNPESKIEEEKSKNEKEATRQEDIKKILKRRINWLRENFPEVQIENSEVEFTISYYKKYLRRIFNHLLNLLKQSKAIDLLSTINLENIDEETLIYMKKAVQNLHIKKSY